MTTSELASAYPALLMLVNDFFRALDENDTEVATALFLKDGRWIRPSGTLNGVDEIRAEIAKRNPERISRHIVSNLRILEFAPTRCRIAYNLTTYAGPRGNGGVIDLEGPAGVLDCDDVAVLTDGQWLFAERSAAQIFRRNS